MQKKRFVYKPIHFILLIAIDLCVLAGVVIPQRSRLQAAQEELTQKTERLNELKIEYEREHDSLDYMKTDAYKLQQGSIKYGWHYKEDTIIPDDAAMVPAPTVTPDANANAAPTEPAATDTAPTEPATTDDAGVPENG